MKISKSDKFYALKKTLERKDLRDTFRALFVLIKNDLELDIDPKKIYSILDGYELLLRTIKTFSCNNKSKALLKEINDLKEEIELLSKDNKNLKLRLEEKIKTNEVLLKLGIDNSMTMIEQNPEHQKRVEKLKEMNFLLTLSTVLFGGVAFYLYFKGVCL
ncbi:hypothetical protein [Fusobacterium sp.]|uniref:hypothetical protein n=1 Tax=Fusobacterium sp. TaxID=68766 RepID=UPI0025BFAB0F|nr:hypothetical protein [Fusobacterium sp.]MCI7223291.1 hypothetical protein [Fusobacterium sp.]